MRAPDSPFVIHQAEGVLLDLPRPAQPPGAEVVERLKAAFLRVGK